MKVAQAYERASAQSGSLICPFCHVDLPLVPLRSDGPIHEVVAQRVRTFEREHKHEGFAIRIVLPLSSTKLRSVPLEKAVGE